MSNRTYGNITGPRPSPPIVPGDPDYVAPTTTNGNGAELPASRLAGSQPDERRSTDDPWASGESLAGIEAFLLRYVAFATEHEAVAIALWIAHAHLVEAFDVSPILTVTSAELRSGKTRVLDCLELLVPEPVRMVIPSEAVVYTILARRPRPTLLLDETDAIFGPRTSEKYEGLRAILNSGNRRGTPVLRVNMEGKKRRVEEFDVYGPKAVAGIGNLPSTVTDRAVSIRMRRRSPDEVVARFRQRVAALEAQQLAFDWASVEVDPYAEVPEELNDRAADSWEPLIAIADAVGGAWPARARLAALALTGDVGEVSVGIRLLADIREVFGDEPHLTTNGLLERLHDLEDAPWGDWYGKPLTAEALSRLLKPYRIGPVLKRLPGERRARGYFRTDFTDAWRRYVTGVTGVTGSGDDNPSQGVTPPTTDSAVSPISSEDRPVDDFGLWQPVTPVTPVTVEEDYPPSSWEAS